MGSRVFTANCGKEGGAMLRMCTRGGRAAIWEPRGRGDVSGVRLCGEFLLPGKNREFGGISRFLRYYAASIQTPSAQLPTAACTKGGRP